MSNTHLNFGSGDESAEFFWRQVQQIPGEIHHVRKQVSTDWGISDALETAAEAGITVKKLFTGYVDTTVVVVAELGIAGRVSCLMLLRWYGEKNFISGEFAASSMEDMHWYAKTVLGAAPEPPERKPEADDGIFVDFTYMGQQSPQVVTREITAPEWQDISGNYAGSAAGKLAELIKADPGSLTGKVAVLQGTPGGGKTFFLRALVRAWADRADFSYIVDAEQFFTDPHYMMKVLLGSNDYLDDDEEEEKWHVILLEDAEEFIAPSAKNVVGQALSRLLNLGDGMLGQGLKVLFIFTTNVKMDSLHPAVVRDGRCFLQAEIPAFTPAEAVKWLRDHGDDTTVTGGKTLSELYRILRDGSDGDVAGVYDPSQAYL